jgi:heme/copper-type cytochrome/quinol oxidase subunit 2
MFIFISIKPHKIMETEPLEYAVSNVDWILVGVKLVLGFLGTTVFAVWKVRAHLNHFSFRRLWNENKAFWAWSISMITLVLAILTISPDAGKAIKTMIGLDVSGEPASFLLMGWSLSALSNQISKKKLTDKKE